MDAFAALFGRTDPPLWLLTARDGPHRGGLIATGVLQASIAPGLPRVLVCLARQHATWELVEVGRAFALHLLGADRLDWVWRFGLRSGRDGDKLEGLSVAQAATGCPILPGTLGWMDCRVEAKLDTGDRTVYLGEVVAAREEQAGPPLTVKQMLQSAPPEHLQRLKELYDQDGVADAALIRRWRELRDRSEASAS